MNEPSEFQRGQIAGASVLKTAELFNVLRRTVSKISTASAKQQTALAKRLESGWKSMLINRDRQTLDGHRILNKSHKIIASKLEFTARLPFRDQLYQRSMHKDAKPHVKST